MKPEEVTGELARKIRLAVSDPGAFLSRGREVRDGEVIYEPLPRWSARAVAVAVLPEHEKQVREQIATEIEETVCAPPEGHKKCPDCYRYQQMKRDAKIARGTS